VKKVLIHVILFFGICFIIGIYSESLNEKIVFKYADNVVTEIQGKVNNNEILYLNSKILVAYVIASNEKNIIMGSDKATLKEFASSISDHKVYKVEKVNGALNITNVANVLVSSIDSLQRAENVTKLKNLVMNIITVLMGVFLYYIYNKSEKKRLDYVIENAGTLGASV